MYGLAPALSRAFSVSAAAAAATVADVFGLVVALGEDGFNGNGGGARSGSELSHLNIQDDMISESTQRNWVSFIMKRLPTLLLLIFAIRVARITVQTTYIGT